MIWQELSVRCDGRQPRPAWGLLYLIAMLLVAVVALIETFVDGDGLRRVLETPAVIGGFALTVVWRRLNRITLDLDRRHL